MFNQSSRNLQCHLGRKWKRLNSVSFQFRIPFMETSQFVFMIKNLNQFIFSTSLTSGEQNSRQIIGYNLMYLFDILTPKAHSTILFVVIFFYIINPNYNINIFPVLSRIIDKQTFDGFPFCLLFMWVNFNLNSYLTLKYFKNMQ